MWFLSPTHRNRFVDIAGPMPELPCTHTGSMPIEPPVSSSMTRGDLRRSFGMRGFTLLFLGRLVPVKGVDRLLRAVAASGAPIHVRIAGDGAERDRLVRLARVLGVDARFEGWVAEARKDALLRASDALAVPSRQGDGLPTVLFEARARGLPVVATRLPAIRGYQGAAGSQLVTAGDDDALRDALARVARSNDPDRVTA